MVFISAAHKSSGKTTVAIGLAAAVAARDVKVQTFKKGPDYIDPMWLTRASGRPCYNLDFNTQSPSEILETFFRHRAGAGFTLIEGNKGLHDGVDPHGRDSSAALAKLIEAPVVLVVDASGMTRGIAPLVLGYRTFDREVPIAGVILNKVGCARQESKLRQALELYTDIPVLGTIGRDRGLAVDERHLGLMTPAENRAAHATIARIARAVASGVDVERLVGLMHTAPDQPVMQLRRGRAMPSALRLAVARDRAFGFYYPDDLEALERAGARLLFFDTIEDARLPQADALFIGGGFPETQARLLEANTSLRGALRQAIRAGLPTYAECGGLMYLARSIVWHGEKREMVGVIPADAVVHERPQGRGLVRLEETADAPWPRPSGKQAAMPAHEFHHASLENLEPGLRFAYRIVRGQGIDGGRDGIVLGNMVASFSHLRDTSRNRWAGRFVSFARAHARVVAPPTTCTLDAAQCRITALAS
jgi:cobyrinic acid a,c-diamide synthase